MSQRCKTAILISGSGTNLQAFIDAANGDDSALDIGVVFSNNPNAYGLKRAQKAGIPTACIAHGDYPDRDTFDAAVIEALDHHQPELIILAGFMRILTEGFVSQWEERMLNIHPSLLPKYKGLHTHARALEAGDSEAGCSVHLVTASLDDGPVLGQAHVPILANDTADTLAARVLVQEHILYPAVLRRFAAGDLTPVRLPTP